MPVPTTRRPSHLEDPLSAPDIAVPRPLRPGPLTESPAVPAPGAAPDVWLLSAAEYADALPGDLALLDGEERRRYAAFVRDSDRRSYGCAHVGLRRLLAAYTGAEPGELEFARATCPTCGGPHGRPVLRGRHTPHFSLSHSGDLVLMAVAAAVVGADVETLPRPDFVDDISTNLHPREYAELTAIAAAEERRAAFARCWTRKEAYLKGTGEGLSATTSRDYVGTGLLPAALPGWTLTDCQVGPGYAAALALARPAS